MHDGKPSNRKPWGYVTKSGAVVSHATLSQYASKGESRSIRREEWSGVDGLVSPLYDPESLARHLEANTYHARCVRTKAQDVAGVGWAIEAAVEDPSKEQRERALEWLDQLPEPIESTLTQAMIDREAIGYMALELVRPDRNPDLPPVILGHLPAHTVRAASDGVRYVQKRGSRKVWFKAVDAPIDVHSSNGTIAPRGSLSVEDRANEIVWDKIYTPRSDVYGIPDHVPAVSAILGEVARQDYNLAFFQNHGVPAYAVHITGDFDPGDLVDDNGNPDPAGKTEMQRAIEGHVEQLARNPHSILILSIPTTDSEGKVEVEFVPLATEVKEASFRMFRQDNQEEVFSAHAVPPYRAGVAKEGSLGGSTSREMDEIYRDSVVGPRQVILERIVNDHVLAPLGVTDFVFNILDLDTSDVERDVEIAVKLFEHGGMTPNDLIRNFGEQYGVTPSDHPAMDLHYLGGKPLDGTVEPDEAEAVLRSTLAELTDVVRKHAPGG